MVNLWDQGPCVIFLWIQSSDSSMVQCWLHGMYKLNSWLMDLLWFFPSKWKYGCLSPEEDPSPLSWCHTWSSLSIGLFLHMVTSSLDTDLDPDISDPFHALECLLLGTKLWGSDFCKLFTVLTRPWSPGGYGNTVEYLKGGKDLKAGTLPSCNAG